MHKSWLRSTAFVLALALILAACGGPGDVPGDGPGNGPEGPVETVGTVIVTQDTEPELYGLSGRYRVNWTHRCQSIGISLQDADGTPIYERTGRSPTFSAIVTNVPEGLYQFIQTEAECETYEIRLDRL